LLRALKADPVLALIPFIFYSSTYTGEKEAELAMTLGAEAFVTKPTEPSQLWEKTCAVMQEWEARNKQPAHPAADESDEQYLREYSRIVATKLEEKVGELEEALALRSKAEEELRRLNAELEKRVAREVEKNSAKDRVMAHQARLAAMGELLSNIAHQWRQPLNNISLLVQSLQQDQENGCLTAESCGNIVNTCMNHLLYLSKTIDTFRSFYRPDQEREIFELRMAVTDALSLVSDELTARGIGVETCCNVTAQVSGYRNEFIQVLLNLMVNAKEALLKQQTASPHLTVSCESRGNTICIRVTDNGGGIPDDLKDKVFDPYFTTKFSAQGVGMGLYMARMIVEKQMAGAISLKSSDAGTTVEIELPRAGVGSSVAAAIDSGSVS
jgi:signal transduction histidine kinase